LRVASPKGKCFRDRTFADDTAFYLKGTKDNMDKVKKVFDTFCLASGDILIDTYLVQFGLQRRERIGIGGLDIKLKWVVEGEAARYLGEKIGFHLATKANFVKFLDSLKKKPYILEK
jgi:hypothetical protein